MWKIVWHSHCHLLSCIVLTTDCITAHRCYEECRSVSDPSLPSVDWMGVVVAKVYTVRYGILTYTDLPSQETVKEKHECLCSTLIVIHLKCVYGQNQIFFSTLNFNYFQPTPINQNNDDIFKLCDNTHIYLLQLCDMCSATPIRATG